MEYLLQIGFNINTTDFCNWTPLCVACDGGHVRSIRFLIQNGANVNIQSSKKGYTALMDIIVHRVFNIYKHVKVNTLDVVKILVEEGKADLNVKSKSGKTALDYAREKNRVKIVEYLEQKLMT